MNRSTIRMLVVLGTIGSSACSEPTTPGSPPAAGALAAAELTFATVREEGWDGGAIVLNPGEGKPDGRCFFQGTYFTMQTVVSRSPSGNWTLSCTFENLPEIAEQETLTGWLCSIIGDPSA